MSGHSSPLLRFLILPWARVPHLASHVLSRILHRLSNDWQKAYGHPVHFVETFVDPTKFRGTCYRAANWVTRLQFGPKEFVNRRTQSPDSSRTHLVLGGRPEHSAANALDQLAGQIVGARSHSEDFEVAELPPRCSRKEPR